MKFKGLKTSEIVHQKRCQKRLILQWLITVFSLCSNLFMTITNNQYQSASNGPTHGEVLAKLLIQAVALMERAGTKIHGKVKIGLNTPMDGARKVYFFSDAPHLMKTIRNRLASSGKLRVNIFCE